MFGYSVALSRDGSTLAVGSFDEDGSGRGINPPSDNRNAGSGAAYVFARVASNWSQQAYIKPSNSESQDSFGVHVALSDDGATLLAGSLDEDCPATGVNPPGCDNDWNADLSMGAAYVFVRAGATWSQQAFLKPSNTGPERLVRRACRAERRRQHRGDWRAVRGRRCQRRQWAAG